jgi:pilus assembly protein FimV
MRTGSPLRPNSPAGESRTRAPLKSPTLTVLLAAGPAAALALGLDEPAVDSFVGQPLRARIPVLLQPGETVFPGCIELCPPQAAAAELALPGVRIELMDDGHQVLVTTASPVRAPVATFSIRLDCPGQDLLTRDYTLLLDPPGVPTPAPAEPPPPPAPPAAPTPRKPPAGTPWELRPGERVRDIAAAIYPRSPGLQRQLTAAIVRASPEAFPEGDPDRPAPGAVIVIPDLRTLGAGEAERRPSRAPGKPPSPPAPVPPAAAEPTPRAPGPPTPAPGHPGKPPAAPALAQAGPAKGVAGGLPLSAYWALLEKIARLEALLNELRARVTALPDVAAAPPPRPVPARVRADEGPSLGFLAAAAALLLALGAAVLRRLKRRRAEPETPRSGTPAPAKPAQPYEEIPLPAVSGVDSALHEAQLSVARGYPERAFELLETHIRAQPGETRAWMLFFAILRSQHMPGEYAELALRFRATKPAPALWQEVQRMGRELDPGNSLYRDEAVPAVES